MNRRNFLYWLAGLICCLGFFVFAVTPSKAIAAEEMTFETESARFTYEAQVKSIHPTVKTATIIKIKPLREELVIPAVVDDCYVTKISRNALNDAAGDIVTSIVMEKGIETVEASAFKGLKNLNTLYLPDSLQSIEPAAFSGCRALTEIRMPAAMDVRNIGNDAFCEIGTDTLIMPDGTDLMAVSLEKYRRYGRDFYGPPMSAYQDGFAYIVREDGGAIIIQGLDTLKAEIQVPAVLGSHPVREIGISAFEGNWEIRSLILPEGLEIIAEKAFSDCAHLNSVQLPSSVSEIGSKAFYNIAGSSPELFSEDVRCAVDWYLGQGKKDSTGQWTYSLLADESAVITDCVLTPPVLEFPAAVDGHPVVIIEHALASGGNEVISLMKNIKKIIIPEGVTAIGEYAFSGFEALQEISFPSTLKTIGKRAFCYAPLKSITLPEGLETIGASAFLSHEVKHLILPASLKSVGNEAFESTYKKFPSSVTILGYRTELSKGIFGYWHTGSVVTPESWHDYYADEPLDSATGFKPHTITLECYQGSTADETYQFFIKKKYLKPGPATVRTAPTEPVLQAGLFSQDELISEVIVPEGVETIADHAFEGLKMLRKVSLPSTLKAIGAYAFDGCSTLEKLSLPKEVTSLGDACFRGCVSLTGIALPEEITVIPDSAFEGCSALTAAQLPKSGVTRIGARAFASCGALKSFKFIQGLEEIGAMAFDSCTSLKEAKLPDSVRKIGPSAFQNCQKLKTVYLGTGLTELGDYVFRSDRALNSLTVPNTLTAIGKGILDGHRSGLKVVCGAGSAMDAWLQDNTTGIKVSYRKKK